MIDGLNQKDFEYYHEFQEHQIQLERAMHTAVRLYDIWCASHGYPTVNAGCFYTLIPLIEDCVKIGYEQALGIKHKSKDYGITDKSIHSYPDKCLLCKNSYYILGCEQACSLLPKGIPCRPEVNETLE